MNILTNLNLSFSTPKIVKGGSLQLETAAPTPEFWSAWKTNKENYYILLLSVEKEKLKNKTTTKKEKNYEPTIIH